MLRSPTVVIPTQRDRSAGGRERRAPHRSVLPRLRIENMKPTAPEVPPLVVGEAADLPLRGELARVLAVRNPDAVGTLVMLGSPVVEPVSVGRAVLSALRSVARLGDLGVPGTFSNRCADGDCCAAFRADIRAALRPDVRAV